MLRAFIRNGLNQSSRPAKSRPSLLSRPHYGSRGLNGTTSTKSLDQLENPKSESPSDLTAVSNDGIQGSAHVESGKADQEKDTHAARHGRRGALSGRQLMRRIHIPKRYRSLLREMMRSGAQSAKYIDPSRGDWRKLMTRSALNTEVLEAELRWVGKNTAAPRAVYNILRILIEERNIKPTSSHYESFILGQSHPEFGSIENVKLILEQMEHEGIPLEASVLTAVLTVLSVHPDEALRSSILFRLAQQQFILSDDHVHLNILCLIREGQLELATVEFEKLFQRSHRGTAVPDWLWTIYIHAICDVRNDFDALLQLLYKLSDSCFFFPRPTLLHLLLKASKAEDLHVTKFIWHGFVESMHIIPDEDLCLSVLRIAAKKKDLKLAESVAVVLESVSGNKTTDPPSIRARSSNDHVRISEEDESEFVSDSLDQPPLRDASESTMAKPSEVEDINNNATNEKELNNHKHSLPAMFFDDPDSRFTIHSVSPDVDPELPLPTSPNLSALPPPPRTLPPEALTLLHDLGITGFDPAEKTVSLVDVGPYSLPGHTEKGTRARYQWTPRRRRRNKPVKGILYPLFREEAGLAAARFDPRLALMKGWDWRKDLVSKRLNPGRGTM